MKLVFLYSRMYIFHQKIPFWKFSRLIFIRRIMIIKTQFLFQSYSFLTVV